LPIQRIVSKRTTASGARRMPSVVFFDEPRERQIREGAVKIFEASREFTALGWVFVAVLAALLVVSVLAAKGRIPLNPWAGIRIPSLMRSSEAWRAGHASAIRPSAIACGAALLCSIVGLFAPVAYLGSIAISVAGLVWVTLRASRAAKATVHA